MKLARKLTVALILGIFAVLLVQSISRVRREMGMFEADMRRDGRTMGRVLATAATEVWTTDGESHAKRLIEQVNESENQVQIRWVSLDAPAGDPTAPRLGKDVMGPLLLGQDAGGKLVAPDGTEDLVTYAPMRAGGKQGAIELSESLQGQRRYVRATLSNVVAATSTLALVCGAMIIAFGVWFVGRPMRSLIEQARRVGAGDLSRRLVLSQHDEIGELAAEMNAMCDRLLEANERAAAEVARRIETLEQLRHADRLATVGRLASGVAHELGAPLQVVSGRAKMIADGDVTGTEAEDYARIIHEQVARMAAMIRQLLDFARRRAADKAPADVADVVRKTCALLSPIADKRRVALELHAGTSEAPSAPDPASVPAFEALIDAAQIQQALTNLIVNGVQAMPAGGVLSIAVRRERGAPMSLRLGADRGVASERDCIRIDVEDRGEGMSPETIGRVFEPFFTTKPPGEGTGLGLAVAHEIVRGHGGWIAVRSKMGQGSCFSIFLPEDRA